ncbi:GATA zinc finger domain-containing protein 15-like [Chironomus tepperi]|uniref:GATA zinc finger domain-containing protein 15-like n=1 Tax=Chironomus tepperi TaxID=113505 RepID=UPI00391F280A
MKKCCLCNKKSSIYDKIVKCSDRNCNYFIHKNCKSKNCKTRENNNWSCKYHKIYVVNSNTDTETESNMPLSRTPSVNNKNDNNNEDPEMEIHMVEESAIQNLNNDTLSPESHNNEENNSDSEYYHEFNQSNIARSTSHNLNKSSRANHSQNEDTVRNIRSDVNFIEGNNVINNPATTSLFNNSPKLSRICNICNKNANRHGFVCRGCHIVCHPICLRDDEEDSADSSSESYLCFNCMKIVQNVSNSINKTPKINNLSNYTEAKDYLINREPNHSYYCNPTSSTIDRKTIPNKNYARNCIQNEKSSLNNNTNGSDEMQLYFIKLQYKELPTVTDSDLTWTVFYSSFIRTKNLYDHDENVIRIQSAIKDDTVKRIGGKGLFNPRTYEMCIEDVNKRLKNNINFLTKEASLLENHSKIKADNKLHLVEYIDKIRNFATLAKAYNDYSYYTNRRFLATIVNVIPTYIRNKWESKQAILDENNIVPSLKHLIEVLDKELPRIEASIRNDELLNADKKSEAKEKNS